MDNRSTVEEMLGHIFSICESRGPTIALRSLMEKAPVEKVESSEYLQALSDAYRSASIAEKSRMRRAIEDLACMGIALPRDLLFFMGFPQKEFGFKVDLVNGRLGDTLGKLAKLVHAMHALNLVLFVRSKLSKSRSVMLC